MKKKSVLFLIVCVLVVGAYSGYKYLYKDHRDIQSEKSSLRLSAKELLSSFQTQSTSAVLNKTLVVHGIVSEVEEASITLNGSVHCVMLNPIQNIKVGDNVAVKGRCIGYDDLFEIVKLDQSQLIDTP